MNIRTVLLFVLLLVCFCSRPADSRKCYICSSTTHANCNEHLVSSKYLKKCPNKNGIRQNCMKAVIEDVTTKLIYVYRECISSAVDNCNQYSNRFGSTKRIKGCSVCKSKDSCNR